MTVAKKVSSVLAELDITPKGLSDETGVSYNSIQKLLSGDVGVIKAMRLETIETALNAMGYKLVVKEKK